LWIQTNGAFTQIIGGYAGCWPLLTAAGVGLTMIAK
jgi:hypothetical protein